MKQILLWIKEGARRIVLCVVIRKNILNIVYCQVCCVLCWCYVEVCADILFTLLGLTSISNFTFDDYNKLRLQTLHYCRCIPDLGPKRLKPWHIIVMSGERKSEKSGVLEHYLALPQPEDRVQCTYVWIDGTGESLRSKTKTVNFIPKTPKGERWELSNKCIHLYILSFQSFLCGVLMEAVLILPKGTILMSTFTPLPFTEIHSGYYFSTS